MLYTRNNTKNPVIVCTTHTSSKQLPNNNYLNYAPPN